MNELIRLKILIGILVGVVILGTTFMLYITGDTVYIGRFMVYSEGFIGAVILWLGLGKKSQNDQNIQIKDEIQMEEMRTD